ncbi:MAG: hypothetical protein AB2A00_05765 [Myxococcota bacterium]
MKARLNPIPVSVLRYQLLPFVLSSGIASWACAPGNSGEATTSSGSSSSTTSSSASSSSGGNNDPAWGPVTAVPTSLSLSAATPDGYWPGVALTRIRTSRDGVLLATTTTLSASGYRLFRSDDDGTTWTRVGSPGILAATVDFCLAAGNADNIFHVLSPDVVVATGDGGATWETVTLPESFRGAVASLACHPDDPDVLLLGDSGGVAWQSTNRGVTWTALALPLSGGAVVAISVGAGGRPYVLRDQTLFSLADDGTTWTSVANIVAPPVVAHPLVERVVYATRYGDIIRSTDDGQNWTTSLGIGTAEVVEITPTEDGTSVFTRTAREGVYKSVDGGDSFQRFDGDLQPVWPAEIPDHELGALGLTPNAVILSSWAGTRVSSPESPAWEDASHGLPIMPLTDMEIVGTTVLAVSSDGRLHRRAQTSTTFAPVTTTPPTFLVGLGARNVLSPVVESPGSVWATGAGAWRSSNSGQTWQQGDAGLPDVVYALASAARNPLIAFAATDAGVYKTINGNAWVPTSTGLPGSKRARWIWSSPHEFELLFVTLVDDGWHVSRDGGRTWTAVNTARQVQQMVAHPTQANLLIAAAREGVLISEDEGHTWTQTMTFDPEDDVLSLTVDPLGAHHVWMSLVGRGLMASGDGGRRWTAVETEVDNPEFARIRFLGDGTVYLAGGDGIFTTSVP